MKVKQTAFLFVIALILISGCSLQKRTYRKGYYVHWNSSLNKKDKISNQKEKKVEISGNETVVEEPLFASNDKTIILPVKKPIFDSIKDIACGDSLWSSSGTVALVKILEVRESIIKYKRCSNPDGPVVVVPRNSISKIKYSNGFLESFEPEKKIESVKEQKPDETVKNEKPSSRLSNLSLIFAIIALALLFLCALFYFLALIYAFAAIAVSPGTLITILAILVILCFVVFACWILSGAFGIISLIKIQENPKKYGGKGKAIAALSIFLTILMLLAFLLLVFR